MRAYDVLSCECLCGGPLGGPLGIRWAARLIWRRKNFLRLYEALFSDVLSRLTGEELSGHVAYGCEEEVREVEGEDEIQGAFARALARSSATDHRRRYTTVGPHTHDMVCTLGGRSTRSFASQGQHRAFVLALKIAQMQLIHDQLGFFPILLLDDVSSELDKQRNEDLMNYLNTAGGQIFITTTDRRWIRLGDNQKVFTVSGGIIA